MNDVLIKKASRHMAGHFFYEQYALLSSVGELGQQAQDLEV